MRNALQRSGVAWSLCRATDATLYRPRPPQKVMHPFFCCPRCHVNQGRFSCVQSPPHIRRWLAAPLRPTRADKTGLCRTKRPYDGERRGLELLSPTDITDRVVESRLGDLFYLPRTRCLVSTPSTQFHFDVLPAISRLSSS